jgi:hypothetical protein
MTRCNYNLDKDLRRKGALRQEIQRLKNRSDDYQFVIDSLCLAEEPRLGQLMQLIRSNQSIEMIADIWRSSGFALLDQLQPAPLLDFDRLNEGNNLEGSVVGPPFLEMATNQTNITISQSNLQTNQPSINISASNMQINQPGVPMSNASSIAGIAGITDITGVIGLPGVPVMPDQVGPILNQSMTANTLTGPEENQDAPLNLNSWYEWGRLWPTF